MCTADSWRGFAEGILKGVLFTVFVLQVISEKTLSNRDLSRNLREIPIWK